MGKKLIIVESPTKARTLSSILGNEYIIESSVGHIRDLPKSRFGVDVDQGFVPEYVTISGKQKVVETIRKAGQNVDEIYLAADPDREGEAICWHLMHYLEKLNVPIHRILYYEITPAAIRRSLESPLAVDFNKVNAQQARRVLDRIVGYRLSPLLWKKVRRGISAGRVQSVALKIICDREKEVRAFVPEEYWLLSAQLSGENPPPFKAVYHGPGGKKKKLTNETECTSVYDEVNAHPFIVNSIIRKKMKRQPSPPFITSTLQQEASRRFRFPVKKTMRVAQSLYEGKQVASQDIHGLITYMRTDSPRISDDAQSAARDLISQRWGTEFMPEKPIQYRARKSAQEAHEAIRPTDVTITPEKAVEFLKGDDLKLYRLIWNRFVASQMSPAVLNVTTAKIGAGENGRHEFRAVGTEIVFKGFMEITGTPQVQTDEKKKSQPAGAPLLNNQELPPIVEGGTLACVTLESKQNFTKPPPRFTEATLVRELEAKGIGRPSTYAAIMSTIRNHDYAEIRERRFMPTELGFVVAELLTEHFPEIMSISFTAGMENKLDNVEAGDTPWQDLISEFYLPFAKNLKEAEKNIKAVRQMKSLIEGVECPECKSPMAVRWGRRGRFLSCSRYPDCKGLLPYPRDEKPRPQTKSIPTEAKCTECEAPMVLKTGRYGLFLTCSRFPACKGKGIRADGLPCSQEGCDGKLVQKRRKGARNFHGCSNYPECTFIFSSVPIPVPCESCGNTYMGAAERNGEYFLTCPACNTEHVLIPEESDPENGTGDTTVSDVSGS